MRVLRAAALLSMMALMTGCSSFIPVQLKGGERWADARDAAARARGRMAEVGPDGLIRHMVLPGDTVSEVAQRYRSRATLIVQANRLRDADRIYAGQVLIVPPATYTIQEPVLVPANPDRRRATVVAAPLPKPGTPAAIAVADTDAVSPERAAADGQEPAAELRMASAPSPMPEVERDAIARAAQIAPPPLSGDGFLWPVEGEVLSAFGSKPNGQRNDGINIAAEIGSPVRAAEHGIVVYTGDEIPGFGNMLLVRHADGFVTAYAHAHSVEVAVGQTVRRGEVVARLGASGNVATPQLHFELRAGRDAVDPQRFLTHEGVVVAEAD